MDSWGAKNQVTREPSFIQKMAVNRTQCVVGDWCSAVCFNKQSGLQSRRTCSCGPILLSCPEQIHHWTHHGRLPALSAGEPAERWQQICMTHTLHKHAVFCWSRNKSRLSWTHCQNAHPTSEWFSSINKKSTANRSENASPQASKYGIVCTDICMQTDGRAENTMPPAARKQIQKHSQNCSENEIASYSI